MNRTHAWGLVCLAAGATLGACEKKTDSSKKDGGVTSAITDSVNKAVDTAKEKAGDAVEAVKAQAVESAQKGLDAAKVEFDALKAKADKVPASMKPEFDKAVSAIEDQFKTVSGKMDGLKSAGADTWKAISDEIAPAVTKLQGMLKDAVAKFSS